MAGMSTKEIARVLDHIQPQGVTVTRTTKGYMLRLPDRQTTVMLHTTGSDHREAQNVRARLKRHGVSWPTDHTPLRGRITDTKPTRHTLERAREALAQWPGLSINGTELRAEIARLHPDERPMQNAAAQRALYHLGWEPQGSEKRRRWLRPVQDEPEPLEAAQVAQEAPEGTPVGVGAPEAVQAPQQALVASEGYIRPGDPRGAEPEELEELPPVPEPGQLRVLTDAEHSTHRGPREILDTADSWTADPAALPEGMTVTQLLAMLAALGLHGEIRVWRAPDAQ